MLLQYLEAYTTLVPSSWQRSPKHLESFSSLTNGSWLILLVVVIPGVLSLYILYRRRGIPKEPINVELGLSQISAWWQDCPELWQCLGTRVTTELVHMGLSEVQEWKGVSKVLDTRRSPATLG